MLVYTKTLLSLLAYYTLPFLIQLLSCSFSSQSLGQLLVLGGSRWRLAAESDCSFGASVHRASSGGRLMKPCSRGPESYVSDCGQESRGPFFALAPSDVKVIGTYLCSSRSRSFRIILPVAIS